MYIRVYAVGIHFRHNILFQPDITDPATGIQYMSGAEVLKACAHEYHLRYKLSTTPPSVVQGHINYLSYTPDHKPDKDPTDTLIVPRVTFGALGTDPIFKVFPFFGQPLSLIEVLRPLGEISQVLQYTVQSRDSSQSNPSVFIPDKDNPPGGADIIGPGNDSKSSFGGVGIPDETEVRIRLLSIYCTY